ncbi:MAG TPA: selenocysteine-specific translation elongation factor [Acidimicrobiia bacterium]|nr:selenocysteine-specific translation elongation factor [Acidimicrobiia bacterium]
MRTVATAGHVDHGKSSLVQALTGTDPDRFTEEKERGLTIDLGFAFTTLPSGLEIGFVDVPGHVRFIKNMLAGVGAVEVVLFVVAATEGWMPQSEEHLRILELLGIRHGMVALTKADLVDDEMLELAQLEVEERLASSPLAGAPVVACDSVSGRGLDEVRAVLDTVLAAAPAARDVGRPRLWIDRVFAMKGAGTIVTGTLTGGSVAVDDELRAGSHPVRVRGIETAGQRVETAPPGSRVALNLAGVEHRSLRRGDAVVRPDQWRTPSVIDAGIVHLPGEEAKRRARLHAAVGSGEHRVWFRALGADGRFARLRFDAGLPLAPGDRIVLRDAGRRRTLAGAEVLDVAPVRRARDVDGRLSRPIGERLLTSRGWLDDETLGRDGGLGPDEARAAADDLVARGLATRVDRWVVDTPTLTTLRRDATIRVADHHRRHPRDTGVELAALADVLDVPVPKLRAALTSTSSLVVDRGMVRDPAHGSIAESADARRVLTAFETAPFAPPDPSDGPGDRELVRALVREGLLVDVDGVVFSAGALDQARETVIAALRERPHLTVADIRDLLGSTRKYVVPICGWLDRNGITRRRGDERIPGPASRIRS